jgi:hypothetical protein
MSSASLRYLEKTTFINLKGDTAAIFVLGVVLVLSKVKQNCGNFAGRPEILSSEFF